MALTKPPQTYSDFIACFPGLHAAWEQARAAASEGPLKPREVALLKLGIAIGTQREGAVRSAARKAVAAGATREEVSQVIALAAGTIGFPATVAVFSWIREASEPTRSRPGSVRSRRGA